MQKARTTAALCYNINIPPIAGNDSPRNDSFRREKRGLLAFLGDSVVSLGKQQAEIRSINKKVVGFENQKDITKKFRISFKNTVVFSILFGFCFEIKAQLLGEHDHYRGYVVVDTGWQ